MTSGSSVHDMPDDLCGIILYLHASVFFFLVLGTGVPCIVSLVALCIRTTVQVERLRVSTVVLWRRGFIFVRCMQHDSWIQVKQQDTRPFV